MELEELVPNAQNVMVVEEAVGENVVPVMVLE
jgi:hypothetical protein